MTRLYFDHAASAPRRLEVSEAMARWTVGVVGNPSGAHRAAREAKRAVEDAREVVATHLGARPGEVTFTGGGTESCHAAVVGRALDALRRRGSAHLVVSSVEHHAVLDAADWAAANLAGVTVRRVPVDSDGRVDLAALGELVDDQIDLVSVMAANNETGVLQGIDEVASLVASGASGAVLHSDAVAAAPWVDLAVATRAAGLVSICAHKLGGPVNAGALIVRSGVGLASLVPGGGQERGRRGGTVDVAAAVGLATALECAARERDEAVIRVRALRERLEVALGALSGAEVTAARAPRLPGTVHVTFDGVASDELLFLLDQAEVCASAAASCSSGATASSHVLAAMGVDPGRARGALRLSMGAETSAEEVERVIEAVTSALARLRSA